MAAQIGEKAPDFELRDQHRQLVSRKDLEGSKGLIVFIPFPFTGICTAELCMVRDHLSRLQELDAKVVAITCDTLPANAHWAEENGYEFPVLSDFWPHGETCKAYGTFNDTVGASMRYTFVLDRNGVVREIINTEALSEAREFEEYVRALGEIE